MSKRGIFSGESSFRKSVYILGTVLVLAICVFAALFMIYTKNLNDHAQEGLLATTNELVPNNQLDLLETSTSDDKNVTDTMNVVIEDSEQNTSTQNISKVETKEKVENKTQDKEEKETEQVKNETQQTENVQEPKEEKTETIQEEVVTSFIAPVSGEIIKDYADETLVYSETLKEWTNHMGIDIRAEKTSVVQAAAKGVVESIKNDPRYGLTVTIAHTGNFKTVYSNLLTAEFISEGEAVEEGQTIGTVGSTAAFEIADESHLHFEILKDNQNVNPTIYLK